MSLLPGTACHRVGAPARVGRRKKAGEARLLGLLPVFSLWQGAWRLGCHRTPPSYRAGASYGVRVSRGSLVCTVASVAGEASGAWWAPTPKAQDPLRGLSPSSFGDAPSLPSLPGEPALKAQERSSHLVSDCRHLARRVPGESGLQAAAMKSQALGLLFRPGTGQCQMPVHL